MKFELKDEYLHWGEVKMGSTLCELALPSGVIKVAIVIGGKKAVVSGFGRKCSVLNEPKIPALLFSGAGFLPKGICGDAIITMHEMGYDLTSKDDIKRAIKQDREKIVAEYEKLASEQPELFDASKVDTSQLSQVIEKSGAEAATASEEKDTNTDASPEKVDKDKNITVKDLKFPLLESYFTYKRSMGMNGVSQIILPSGKYETESIFNGNTYFHSSVFDCDITGISASKNNKLFQFSVSAFGDVRVCGDILITLIEMDKYDFRNKKETKKIKGDKDYILENYFRLLEEKPELFDASKIDFEKMEQETKRADAKAVKESLKIDYDKFNNKKTITSNSSIRHDMTDLFAGISTAMKSYTNILDVVSSAVQYLTLTPRYVETPNMGSLVIDLHYTGNDWIFFENGNLIFMADDTNYTFPPEGKTSDVHGGGKVDENLYYFIPINDYKSIAKSTKVEIQVSGRSIKVEFALEEKDISILDNFYTGVFEGDDPLVDIKSVQTTKEAAPQEKQQEQSQPKQVDIKSELKKYKEMLDDGLITQEDFDTKKKELLGL